MSVRVMSLVFRAGPARPSDRLMLLAIADHADDSGVAYPGVTLLSSKCGVQKRAAQRTIKRLVDEGWVSVTLNTGTHGQNHYFIDLARLREGVASTTRGGGVHDAVGVASTTPEPSPNHHYNQPAPAEVTRLSNGELGVVPESEEEWRMNPERWPMFGAPWHTEMMHGFEPWETK